VGPKVVKPFLIKNNLNTINFNELKPKNTRSFGGLK
tara:strand:- start:278 stop:385 length:108 start_codon:yes stop_codon:yes gene_type:complete